MRTGWEDERVRMSESSGVMAGYGSQTRSVLPSRTMFARSDSRTVYRICTFPCFCRAAMWLSVRR